MNKIKSVQIVEGKGFVMKNAGDGEVKVETSCNSSYKLFTLEWLDEFRDLEEESLDSQENRQ